MAQPSLCENSIANTSIHDTYVSEIQALGRLVPVG